jgi:mRNA interferase RelE/StbE
MKITFKKSAIKDLQKLPTDIKDIVTDLLIIQIPEKNQISDIKDLEKLKGYKNYYRIRIKDYRIGVKIEDSKITIIRILHRKEIYKYFP